MEEGAALVTAAIGAGVANDLGSGSNTDLRLIYNPAAPGGEVRTEYRRNAVIPAPSVAALHATYTRPAALTIPRGATVVLSEKFTPSSRGAVAGVGAVAAARAIAAGGGGGGGGGGAAGAAARGMDVEDRA